MTDTRQSTAGYRAGYRYRRAAAPLALRKAPAPVPYRYLYSRYRDRDRHRPHGRLCTCCVCIRPAIRIPHRKVRYIFCLCLLAFPSLIWQQSYPAFSWPFIPSLPPPLPPFASVPFCFSARADGLITTSSSPLLPPSPLDCLSAHPRLANVTTTAKAARGSLYLLAWPLVSVLLCLCVHLAYTQAPPLWHLHLDHCAHHHCHHRFYWDAQPGPALTALFFLKKTKKIPIFCFGGSAQKPASTPGYLPGPRNFPSSSAQNTHIRAAHRRSPRFAGPTTLILPAGHLPPVRASRRFSSLCQSNPLLYKRNYVCSVARALSCAQPRSDAANAPPRLPYKRRLAWLRPAFNCHLIYFSKPRTKRQHPTAALLSLFTVLFLNLLTPLFIFFYFYLFFPYYIYLLPPASHPAIAAQDRRPQLQACALDQLRNQLPPPTQSPSIHRWAPCSIPPPDLATSVGLCVRLSADACLGIFENTSPSPSRLSTSTIPND
ncbi:hypothetical protein HDV63DRAFT_17086 [Trichoderma sp. SZMC 28014]